MLSIKQLVLLLYAISLGNGPGLCAHTAVGVKVFFYATCQMAARRPEAAKER